MSLAALIALLALLPGCVGQARAAPPLQPLQRAGGHAAIPVSVSVDASEPGPTVPQNFLGLSFEVGSLRQIAGYSSKGDLVTMLRSLGVGLLRFGGVTADEQVAWTDAVTARPPWALSVLEGASLNQLGKLAAASGWGVMLTLGFGHYDPQAAAGEAAVAQAALGSSLQAIEIGNEPEAYARHGLRSLPWAPEQYNEQVAAYRAAIEALAPGIPLAGPDSSGSGSYQRWGLSEAIYQRPALLTGHHYPLGCAEQPAPTIARLLSGPVRALEEQSLRRYVFIAQETEVPFRLDESGTVSCGGVPGISNTFASALWGVSYLTEAMRIGAAGINLEGNPMNCLGYTPVCAPNAEAAASGELEARPEWYALLLARSLLGESPLRTIVGPANRPNVVASAFRAADGTTKFVLIDDDAPGARSVAMRLHVGAGFGGGTILSLTAPSPSAVSGIELGGRAVAPNGTWSQPVVLPGAANRKGVITVDVAPSSAALVTVAPKH
ncbi:MAG TPA: glycosyl hydrolase family 79 C-terminal domain-containing protein [Solirubrobacteraceae bacterium]|nr:glycosyl hydrolase family 79 C-terminal domain-containing protein [Solirubrobacteraceae bacterium]